MGSKIIKSNQPLEKTKNPKPSTFFDAQEFALTVSFMAKSVHGYSILVYDANIIGPQDINVCSKLDATTVRLSPSSAVINAVEYTWDETDVTIDLPSYTYILMDPDGNIVTSNTYIENHALISIILSTDTEITEVLNFRNNGKYIVYKKQINVDGEWQWDNKNVQILGAGKSPKFTLDGNVLNLFFEKNGGIFKRTVDVDGGISEFQYKDDYPVNSGYIQPNELVQYMANVASNVSPSTVSLYNPYKLEEGGHGLTTSAEDYSLSYSVQLPFLVNKNNLFLRYVSMTGIILYDQSFNVVETFPASSNGSEIVTIPNDGNTYHIGFEGEYSIVNDRIGIKPMILNVNNYVNYEYNDSEADLRVLNASSASTNGIFSITRTFDNKNQKILELNTLQSSSTGDFTITKTYTTINELVDDNLGLNASVNINGIQFEIL